MPIKITPMLGLRKAWDRNNFPISITIEYSTTGKAGGYMTDGCSEIRAPTSATIIGKLFGVSS
jgi:hypothetical protein